MNWTLSEIIYCLIGFAIGWTWYSNLRRAIKYRKLWLKNTELLIDATTERDQWRKTAFGNHEAVAHEKSRRAALAKQCTDQAETIDALMHGDSVCDNWHRYYVGETCPHCGAKKAAIPA